MTHTIPDKSVIAYIPARLGSERLYRKNLRLLGGEPLITHVARTALQAQRLDQVYLNTESPAIAAALADPQIRLFMRDPYFARSETKTDEILYDFARAIPGFGIAVINPTAPFLRHETIDRVVDAFLLNPECTFFTTTQQRRHLVFQGEPVNFKVDGPSPRTQDLQPFDLINFVILCMSREKIISNFERYGYCIYQPPLSFVAMSGLECHDIDDENDFKIAEAILLTRNA